jgi:hypothetical protein
MTLMGKSVGDNPCYRAQRLSAITAPAVTLHENTEGITLFPGVIAAESQPAGSAFLSTNTSVIQIDVWVSSQGNYPTTGLDTDTIANRIDVLLCYDALNWIADPSGANAWDTHSWMRVSSSQQYEEDTSLWHNALRYRFDYHTGPGFVPS